MRRTISEYSAIEKLANIREKFRETIAMQFEHRANPCWSCGTPGACCLDEHFVNVRVSRLEASAIKNAVRSLDAEVRTAIFARLANIDAAAEFYACPLYQPRIGCLVHDTAKPLPCIAHACYERKDDLPPDEILSAQEIEIDSLNRNVYGRGQTLIPIHAALR